MTYVDEFRKRRYQRLKSRGLVEKDAILEFRKRRDARLDAGEEEESNKPNTPKAKVKGHGNTKLPFGLCQREGIQIEKGWTPTDAWNALEGKGYNAKEEYKGLREGKASGSSKNSVAKKEEVKPEETTEQIYNRIKSELKSGKEKLNSIRLNQNSYEQEKRRAEKNVANQEDEIEIAKKNLLYAEAENEERAGRTKEQIREEIDSHKEEYEFLRNENSKISKRPLWGTEERKEWDSWIDSHGGYDAYREEIREKLYGTEDSIGSVMRRLRSILDDMEEYGEDCGISFYSKTIENGKNKLHELKKELSTKERQLESIKIEYNNEEEKYKRNKEIYKETVKKKFPSYDDCTTKEDVLERFNCESYFKDDGEFEVTEKSDLSLVRSTAKYLSNMMEKFPQMKGKVGNLKIKSFVGVYGVEVDHTYGYSSSDREVCLNENFYSDPEKLKKSYDMCLLTKFHPEGTTIDSIVVHEYGHQIDNLLTKELELTEKSGKQIKFSTQVMKEIKKRTGKKMDEIKAEVSRYSYDNDSGGHKEFFAEALSEYVTSENPREIAMMVGEITERYLKQIDGGMV